MNARKKNVVIIGAGPAGLFAARALHKQGFNPTLLEKESHVGGKANTFSHPDAPEIKTEWGAVLLAPNYGVVLDAVTEKNIKFEESVDARRSTVGIIQKFDALSWAGKAVFAAQLVGQLVRFTYGVSQYHYARDNCLSLPEDCEIPFAQYAEKYGLQDINLLMKAFVSGYGYGDMGVIPTYQVMEYAGVGSIPALAAKFFNRSPLVEVKNGTQYLMERVAEDFNVITSANVTAIDRSKEGVSVTYTMDGVTRNINADALVLAISPLQWTKLGMKLTAVEEECVNMLTYYRYPIAVCKVKGLAAENIYVPKALEKEGFGHLALMTTRDNRSLPSDGRLFTAYINLSQGQNEFSFDKENLQAEIKELSAAPQETSVEVLETKVWEDYLPALPWSQRLKLEKEQMREDTNTLYVGAYPVGGFETIRNVADQATRAVNRHVLKNQDEGYLTYATRELGRAFRFFYSVPRVQPVDSVVVSENVARINRAFRD